MGALDGAPAGVLLRSEDIVVAVDRQAEGRGHEVVRLRRVEAADGSDRILVQALPTSGREVSALAVSGDGRWLATVEHAPPTLGVPTVYLRDLWQPEDAGSWWTSAPGCAGPVFDVTSTRMYLNCASHGRQPASLLELSLPQRKTLSLVGELPRTLVATGLEGDLYWVEEDGGQSYIVRRHASQVGYSTHTLYGRVRALWPQVDGSIVAQYGTPGAEPQLARLLASGLVRDEPRPRAVPASVVAEGPMHMTGEGFWLAASCSYRPCSLVQVGPDGSERSSLHIIGAPTAVTSVPRIHSPVGHVEDLATAPSSVLSSHSAAEVTVLGVHLRMALETAFSSLDRAGRHPYWISARGTRGRPGGVGVGWTSVGYCISFLSDERGLVAAIELKGCAAEYLSPQLAPLLRREELSEGALAVATHFLGPGVSVTVGGGEPSGTGPPIQRTRIHYQAPDRGYEFEAEIELMSRGRSTLLRSRWLGGHVRLRLQTPGRPQASALGVP